MEKLKCKYYIKFELDKLSSCGSIYCPLVHRDDLKIKPCSCNQGIIKDVTWTEFLLLINNEDFYRG